MSKKGLTLVSMGLIVLLGFIAYANSLGGEFILDDEALVQKNMHIRSPSNILKIFTTNIAAGGKEKWNSYRPMQMITYMLDYSVWKLNPFGYRITNVLLHILAALSVYWFIYSLYENGALSLLAGLLFVTHPAHTGAVSYISGRADSLTAVFMLCAFALYIKYIDLKKIHLFILALLCYAFALLSRENSLVFPVLLLLYHYVFKKKIPAKQFLGISALALAYILLRATLLRAQMHNIAYDTTALQRIPGFFTAITNYMIIMLAPLRLHAEYGNKLFTFSDFGAVAGVVIVFFLLLYALEKRKNRLILFSSMWFFITLLPQSNIYPINAYMAEHWLYIPIIGFFVILANALLSLYEKKGLKIIAIVIVAGLLSFYTWLTVRQNGYWKDPLTFYEKTAQHSSWSAKVYNNLGNAYNAQGKYKEAIDAFKKAIEIDPTFPKSYINIGNTFFGLREYEEAIVLYEKALEMAPDYSDIYYNLANTYNAMKKYEDAVTNYKKAIELDSTHLQSYSNLGTVYYALGRYEDAISSYKKAIGIDPDFAPAYSNLGNAYSMLGKYEEGIAYHKKAIEANPQLAKSHYNLGNTYTALGRPADAITALGRPADAIASFKKAVEINPDFAGAHYNLAVLYYNNKQYAQAIKHCDEAARLGLEIEANFLEALKPYRK